MLDIEQKLRDRISSRAKKEGMEYTCLACSSVISSEAFMLFRVISLNVGQVQIDMI
jgi:hypothetical protein